MNGWIVGGWGINMWGDGWMDGWINVWVDNGWMGG